ncbi:MAG: type II toxin-antitoxin system VapC family toxin [Candidatus Manganitrophaceae bacterium]
MSGKVALDTNIAIAVLNGETVVADKLQNAGQIFLPLPVVGELLFGALNSQRAEANLSRIQQLIRHSTILQMGSETASLYARTRMILKQKGRPIPENDIWIAASCLENQMVLMTNDAHFKWIEELTVEPPG